MQFLSFDADMAVRNKKIWKIIFWN